MSDLPLERIEELVEDSVFHPSPCKRHKERVLRHAVRATVRQTVSRRTMAVLGAAVLLCGIVIAIVRLTSSTGETASATGEPASAAAATESGNPAPSGSMGEGLFHASDRGHGQPAANQGL